MTQEERDQRLSALMMCPQDDPENQYQIGLLFYEEFQDQVEARSWLELAAGQGHQGAIEKLRALDGVQSDAPLPPLGHETLGMWCHFCEDSTRSDTDELCYRVALYLEETYGPEAERDVAHYLTQAADKGHPEASLRLGKRLLSTDPTTAVPYLINAADCHLSKAYSLLAECYSTGLGVAPDPEKAATYWEASAQQGNGEEMLRLAIRFKTGDGVPKLMVKAGIWKERAKRAGVADADEAFADPDSWLLSQLRLRAETGDAKAWYKLGNRYHDSDGVEQDYTEAVECYTKAAQLGDAAGWNGLGVCYHYGQGVEQDYKKAVECFTKAAQLGSAVAWRNLGRCYKDGQGVEKDNAKAAECFTKAAQLGSAKGWRNLGVCYEDGQGVEKDGAKAVECYTKAAQLGDATGWRYLGVCYYNGHGVEQDYKKAVECFTKAAQLGSSTGWRDLGVCYEYARGVEQDYAKAVECFTKAAQLGVTDAWKKLGNCYKDGHGAEQDYAEAVECYRKAEGLEGTEGWLQLGHRLATDDETKGIPALAAACYIRAVELYTQAAQRGDAEAWEKLAEFYYNGRGVELDYAKAANCLRQSHGLEDTRDGWSTLLQDLVSDRVWRKSPFLAMECCRKLCTSEAAESAWKELGRRLAEGDGLRRSYTKAVECYRRAFGYEDTGPDWCRLAHYFEHEHNEGLAMECYQRAADLGSGEGWLALGRSVSESKYYRAKEEAAEYYRKAGEAGELEGWRYLFEFYRDGTGVDKDYFKAVECYRRYRDREDIKEDWRELGDSLVHDYDKTNLAAACYIRATELGDTDVWRKMDALAERYSFDRNLMIACYRKAGEQGCSDAWLALGRYYEYSSRQYEKAVECYTEATKLGSPRGWYYLGCCYREGQGVSQSDDMADRCFKRYRDLGGT